MYIRKLFKTCDKIKTYKGTFDINKKSVQFVLFSTRIQ